VRDIRVQEKGPARLSLELADGVVITALTSAIAERLAPASEQAPDTNKGPASLPS
jgi:hypothetical protein